MWADPPYRQISSHPAVSDTAAPLPMTVAAATPAVLLEIVQPGVGLAIWARDANESWRHAIAPIVAGLETVPAAYGAPASIADSLFRPVASGVPAWLAEDVAWLAGLMAALCKTARVSARLSAGASAPAQPTAQGLRLLCRYGGAPLHWWDADAPGVGGASGSIAPFAVALIKGATHPLIRRRLIRLGDTEPLPADTSTAAAKAAARAGAKAGAAGLTLSIEPVH